MCNIKAYHVDINEGILLNHLILLFLILNLIQLKFYPQYRCISFDFMEYEYKRLI